MATLTKITKFRRSLRRDKMGRARKNKIAIVGTTPAFAIHTEESHKNAPKDQLPNKGEG